MSDTTKRALAASLRKLLEKRPLNKITVKDIVEDCGVNRQTFYYHFHDIYALMEWIFNEDAEKFFKTRVHHGAWEESVYEVFHYMRENRALILNACNSLSRGDLEQYLFRRIRLVIMELARKDIQDLEAEEEDLEFVVRFYTYALIGFGIDWINHGMREGYDKKIAEYFVLIHGSLPRELKRLTEYKKNS